MSDDEKSFGWTAAYLALFLTILTSRLFLIITHGHPLPFSDEWDAGAAGLYAPYAAGTLRFEQLLSAHNEHRFLTSRLLGLLTFELAGGWLPRFQMVVNAMIFSGFAVWSTATLGRMVRPQARLALVFLTGLAFSLPIDFEVSLMGMNAHVYFLIIFSLAALKHFSRADALTPSWWLGIVWSGLAFLSMSSAVATPPIGIIVTVIQMLVAARPANLRNFAGLAVLGAVTALMVSFVPTIDGHDFYRAHSLWEFLVALMAIAALPLISPLGVLFVHWPLLVHVIETLRKRPAMARVEWFGIAMAGWIAAQMISVAIFRAPTPLSPRYLDFVVIALPLSAAVVLRYAPVNRGWLIAGSLWLFVVVSTTSVLSYAATLREAGHRHAKLDREQPLITGFLATGDAALLAHATLSYPRADALAATLSDPDVRSILPPEIRPPDAREIDANRLLLKGGFRSQIEAILGNLLTVAVVAACLAASFAMLAMLRLGAASTRRWDEAAGTPRASDSRQHG
ncbi:MAG: hypothetical protein ABIO40_03390 [Devosia sp.]